MTLSTALPPPALSGSGPRVEGLKPSSQPASFQAPRAKLFDFVMSILCFGILSTACDVELPTYSPGFAAERDRITIKFRTIPNQRTRVR